MFNATIIFCCKRVSISIKQALVLCYLLKKDAKKNNKNESSTANFYSTFSNKLWT